MVKNPPANAGDARDAGSIPGSGRSPGGGNGKPTPVFFENSHGQRSLVGYSSWRLKESDVTEHAGTAASCLSTPTNTTLRMDYIPNKTIINLTHKLNYLLYSYCIYYSPQQQ